MNSSEEPAFYVNPQLALEIMQALKTHIPEEIRSAFLTHFDGLVNRDLAFYTLGKIAACQSAEDALRLAHFRERNSNHAI